MKPKGSIIDIVLYCFYAALGILFGVLCFGLAGSLLLGGINRTDHTSDSLVLPTQTIQASEVVEEVQVRGKIKSFFRFLMKKQERVKGSRRFSF